MSKLEGTSPSNDKMSFGFGRDRRIRRRADFLRIQSEGKRASTPHFVLLVASRADARDGVADPARAPSRLGIVVTKKVGNAAVRSRIKRLCRECFRTWPDLVPTGVDLVVIARPGADELALAGVRAEWERSRRTLLERCHAVLEASKRSQNAGAPDRAASSSARPARTRPPPRPPRPR